MWRVKFPHPITGERGLKWDTEGKLIKLISFRMFQWILGVNCEFHKGWAAFLISQIFARCQMYAFDPHQRHVKIHCPAKASPWMRRRKVECQGRRRFWEVEKFHLLFKLCKTLQNVKSQISRISGSVSDERHPRRASREWPVFFPNLKNSICTP